MIEMSKRARIKHGRKMHTKFFVGKSGGNKPLQIPGLRNEDNIKTKLKF
jgi:hypothetical protein